MIPRIFLYSLAAVGPISSAGAQLVLSLVLLKLFAPADFGSFSFLLVTSQFATGIWGALFCAPLPVLLSQHGAAEREMTTRCLMSINLCAAAGACMVFVGLGLALKVPLAATLLFAGYVGVALIRWFARTYAYATGFPLRSMASDVAYSAVLLGGTGLVVLMKFPPLNGAYTCLLLGTVLGLLPFGGGYLRQQFARVSVRAIARYGGIWKRYSGWSLIGVVTTEATSNAHVYLVTALFGPAAFAPLAASSLMIRPVQVAMNALTEFERAQMARHIGSGQFDAVMGSVRFFRWVLIAAWIATAVAVALLFAFAPRLVFPAQYDVPILITASALWLAVAGARLLRTPESALLQSAGEFRPLARASTISSGVSVVAVAALLAAGGLLWSIVGILLGEIVIAKLIFSYTRTWRDTVMESFVKDAHDIGPEPEDLTMPAMPSKEPSILVTVGIKALNAEKHISAALSSAIEAVRPFAGEVVLADSCSNDGTVLIAQRLHVRVVQLANANERSCGAGAQLAFQHARGEFFYLMDADMVLHPDFLPAAIDYLRVHPHVAAVGGKLREMTIANEEFSIRARTVRVDLQPGMVDRLDGGGLYRVAAVRDAGYFADRNLHAFEEFDLAARLRSQGWKLARINRLAVDHFGHATGGYSLLWRRIRSGYAGAAGEVLRAAIGQRHLRTTLRGLGHIRHGAVVVGWWITLLFSVFVAKDWRFFGVLLGLPIAFLWFRRGSLKLGVYSLASWNVAAFGLLTGLMRKRVSPYTALASVDLSQ